MQNNQAGRSQAHFQNLPGQVDPDNQNLSHSSNGNDDGAGADAEEDEIAVLKPEFEVQPFISL